MCHPTLPLKCLKETKNRKMFPALLFTRGKNTFEGNNVFSLIKKMKIIF